MMEDLDLDIFDLATEMAIGLAILHWEAQVDGMDTEFVLAGRRRSPSPAKRDINEEPLDDGPQGPPSLLLTTSGHR